MKKYITPFLLSFLASALLVINLKYEFFIFPLIAFLAVALYSFFSKNAINVFCVFFFLVSFNVVFKLSPASVSLFSVLELVLVLFSLIKRRSIDKRLTVLVIIFLIYMIVVDALHFQFGFNEYLRQIVNILFLYCAASQSSDKDFSTPIILFYAFGVIASSFVGLYAKEIPHFYDYIRHVGLNPQILNRFTGMNGDPNYYSVNLNISLLGLMYLFVKDKISILLLPFYLLLTYFGLMTLSKSFILIWFLISVLFGVLLIVNKKRIALCLYLIIAAFGIGLLFSGRIEYFNTILSRLLSTSGSANEMTSGRVNLWAIYLEALFNDSHFIYGFGVNAPDVNNRDVHNFLIELLYYFGFIGCFLYALCYFRVLRIKGASKKSILDYSGFVFLFVMYFFLQMVHFNELPFHLTLAYLIARTNRNAIPKKERRSVNVIVLS